MNTQIDRLPQWYMTASENDGYENVHETSKRAGDEFGIGPGMKPIEAAMLERALHNADLLADVRCLANTVNTGLPEMTFGNTVLRFGNELVSYDAYTEVDHDSCKGYEGEPYAPWPARPDEITVHALLTYPDGLAAVLDNFRQPTLFLSYVRSTRQDRGSCSVDWFNPEPAPEVGLHR